MTEGAQEYRIARLTDLLKLDDRQVEQFARELPAIIATMRGMSALILSVATEVGTSDIAVVPSVTWMDDGKHTIGVRLGNKAETEEVEHEGDMDAVGQPDSEQRLR